MGFNAAVASEAEKLADHPGPLMIIAILGLMLCIYGIIIFSVDTSSVNKGKLYDFSTGEKERLKSRTDAMGITGAIMMITAAITWFIYFRNNNDIMLSVAIGSTVVGGIGLAGAIDLSILKDSDKQKSLPGGMVAASVIGTIIFGIAIGGLFYIKYTQSQPFNLLIPPQ
jgi:Co/Zn/Cd efflux system component